MPKTVEEYLTETINAPRPEVPIYDNCFDSANWKAKEYTYFHWLKRLYKLQPELLGDKLLDLQNIVGDTEHLMSKNTVWYIVVNPIIGIDIWDFKAKCEFAMEKKWIKNCKLWYEFRGKGVKGIHANFCIWDTRYQLSRVKNEFKNTFKNFIGDNPKYLDNYINVQNCRRSELEKILLYQFKDNKKSDKKTLKQLMWKMDYVKTID